MVTDNETPPSLVAEKEMPYDLTRPEAHPAPFKQTEVGLIPSDWEVEKIKAVASIRY